MVNTDNIRNIVLLGHAGSGKTSLAESILHKTGASNRLGSVDEKTSICDFLDEEKEHQHSLGSAVVHAEHAGKLLNIIDTPGSPDFIGPAIKAIPAAETAVIVISATAGIETNTRKLSALVAEAEMPRIIVVNKIDADNIDLPGLLKNIQESFGSQCRCANLPAADKGSVIDCIENESGDSPLMDVAQAHTELIESVIEADDDLMESYLGGEDISAEKIAAVFVEALKAGTLVPIVFTNARKEIGVTELLDIIAKYTPSPTQAAPTKLKSGEESTDLAADPAAPLAGLVFRTAFDPRSNMKYSTIRLFSGTIKSDTNLLRNDEKKGIRPGHILKSQGGENNEVDAGIAGDIITLAKVDELKTGDLIHDGKAAGGFVQPPVPEPMYSLALEPASRGDEQKISSALDKLCEEDPCFKIKRDQQTKELVASGLGDLHLRVMLEKMENRSKLSVNTKEPKIPYRETITTKAEGHYRHKKQTGGAGQFGEVYLRVEPTERGADPALEFSWDIFGGSIPRQFEPAVAKGINEVMLNGVVAGFPLQDVKVSIYDGKHHPVDSKEVAFRAAGREAFKDGVLKAKPVLLEPIVNIEVTIPAENVGDITGDLSSKRGRVLGQDTLPGNIIVIKAQVPLAEVAQYNSQLKSVTGGRGSYSMTLSHYELVPSNVQQQIVAQYAKKKESD
ncbi:MAG: elongation factor G [Phycisphaerae bacterium]|nr:elongation factor G [Phycisphaerae bacterium]NIW72814.1 elongation factor G [candidate division KSB1 bacterium]NIP52785.1 elongation factor G [Phycisphaerae bacterium]NIS51801.1 elongation factor G [Phycisphaerae bacterium]NIU09330.1 elongation factor G [Phycisphaerae bacterium]